MLTNAIGFLGEAAWHHADLAITWGKLWVKLKTHSAGGITDKDFALARQIENVALWRPPPGGSSCTPSEGARQVATHRLKAVPNLPPKPAWVRGEAAGGTTYQPPGPKRGRIQRAACIAGKLLLVIDEKVREGAGRPGTRPATPDDRKGCGMGSMTRYQAVRAAIQELGPTATKEAVAEHVLQHYGLQFDDRHTVALYISMVNSKMSRKQRKANSPSSAGSGGKR